MHRTLLPLPFVLLSACVPPLPESSPGEGSAAGDCSDEADNDGDGTFDCDDAGCTRSPACADTGEDTDANAAPSGAAIAIEPAAPTDDDDLACTIVTEAVDPNGDAVTYAYAWTVDGADAGLNSTSVGAALTSVGQSWMCTVTPSDGTLTGTPTSATVDIGAGNRAPSAPGVAITPEAPTDDERLTCAVVTESVDPDGDAVTYTYAWSVDGADAGVRADSVDAALTEPGQAWTCTVTATDGTANSAPAVAVVTVRSCDADGDGYLGIGCGGEDCDDADSAVYPRAGDAYGDGVDSDCDGLDCAAASDGSTYFAACPAAEEPASALARCETAGFDGLAEFYSATEQSFFLDLIADMSGHYWIGLEARAGWEWASGSPVTYTNWAPLEPAGDGSCVMLWGPHGIPYANKWNDVGCSGKTADGGEGIGAACMAR